MALETCLWMLYEEGLCVRGIRSRFVGVHTLTPFAATVRGLASFLEVEILGSGRICTDWESNHSVGRWEHTPVHQRPGPESGRDRRYAER